MSNPVLRKLSMPDLTRKRIANLLKQHVGPRTNEYHCGQAIEAIHRIRNFQTRIPIAVYAKLQSSRRTPCAIISDIIEMLQIVDNDEAQ